MSNTILTWASAGLAVLIVGAAALRAAEPPASTRPATTQPVEAEAPVDEAAWSETIKASSDAWWATNRAAGLEVLKQRSGTLPKIRIGTQQGNATWQTLTVSRTGKKLDAFRFRTPPGNRTILRWAFVLKNGDLDSWYICAVEGDMRGFENYGYEDAHIYEGFEDTPGRRIFLQKLPDSSLKPDTEYIIWMWFKHDRPVELELAINLLENPTDSVCDDLGLEHKITSIEDPPDY